MLDIAKLRVEFDKLTESFSQEMIAEWIAEIEARKDEPVDRCHELVEEFNKLNPNIDSDVTLRKTSALQRK